MAIETLRPNGFGDETNLTNSQDWTIDPDVNWQMVDEADADDDTTRNQNGATSVYLRDLYALPASSGSGIINFVKIYVRANWYLPSGYAKPSLKSNSAVTDGTEIELIAAWTTYSQQWNTNPADDEAWEWADIDALQIGVSLKYAKVTQVYVEVDYAEPVNITNYPPSASGVGMGIAPIVMVGVSTLIQVVPALGIGMSSIPIITGGISMLIQATPASGVGIGVVPIITAMGNITIPVPSADGESVAFAPIILTTTNTTISALVAVGSGEALSPISATGTGVLIQAVPASCIGSGSIPNILIFVVRNVLFTTIVDRVSTSYFTGDVKLLKFTISDAGGGVTPSAAKVTILKPDNQLTDEVDAFINGDEVSYLVPGTVNDKEGTYKAFFICSLGFGEQTHMIQYRIENNPGGNR